jgi:TPR repeat protein
MGFRGRDKWLYELTQKLLSASDAPKPYILLNGHEGMGKSALVAKLTDDLSTNKPTVGRNAGLVKKYAPWLPNIILHFGKQSNQPYEIVDLLLAQINTLLLDPIEISQVQITHKDSLQKEPLQFGYFTAEDQIRRVSEKTYLGLSPHEIAETTKTETYDFTLYRRVLYLALEQVVKEKGSVILVIDAVDEISLDGSGLHFLPDQLPIGVSALLSARESKVVKWLENNRDVDTIRLKELEKSEIPLFTNVRNEDGEMQSRFNERVWKASGGWPLMVLDASKLAQVNPNDLDRIHIDRSKDSLFERRVNEWRSTNIDNLHDALIDILKLLSIFEPVAPVDLDLIQAFLESNGAKVSRDEIKQELQRVSSQIEGLDANRIKLTLKAFAEYIRERWLGKKDLLRTLDDIVDWLSKKEYDDQELLAQFLNYWTSSVYPKDIQRSVEKLIDCFIENSEADTLFQIFRGLRKYSKETPILSEISIRCLKSAADLKNITAMLVLGWRLVDGDGLEMNLDEGKMLLENAAMSGDVDAMIILANRLLDGKGLEQNIEEGKRLLTNAVEMGNEKAKYAFAFRLLEGDNVEQDIYQGERLLRELFDQGFKPAGVDLANRLIEGDIIEKDPEVGEQILRDLSDSFDVAAFLLANRLIDGDGLQINAIEGEAILRKLVTKGNREAAFILGSRQHYGRGLNKNVDESLKLLNKLANSGDTNAMQILGELYISGDGVIVDVEVGKRWLTKAAEADDILSMLKLSEYLLNGIVMPKNLQEGKGWIVKAAETQNPRAMYILASRLLNGTGLLKDQKQGMKWLKKAADANDVRAMILLGNKFLYGEGIEKDTPRGEFLLRKAIEDDEDFEAMKVLGVELLEGIALKKNIEEGEELLRQAAKKGNESAMTQLGMRLFDGDGLKQNISEGVKWLNKAIENDESLAKVFLGRELAT